MASKRGIKRREQRKSCGDKVKYNDQTSAVAALISIKSRTKDYSIGTYKCKFCGSWHIGHTPNKVKNAIKVRHQREDAWTKRLGD
jgi:hypothetical protein